jgi:hypothetical protein
MMRGRLGAPASAGPAIDVAQADLFHNHLVDRGKRLLGSADRGEVPNPISRQPPQFLVGDLRGQKTWSKFV